MSNKLYEGLMEHRAKVDKYVVALFSNNGKSLPDWIPIADMEKIRTTVTKYLKEPSSIEYAIEAYYDWVEKKDDQAMFSRCVELNVSPDDAIYLATVFRAIQLGSLQGLPLLLGGSQTVTIIKEIRKAGARKAAKSRHDLPMPTVKALKVEYLDTKNKLGKDAKPTTVYKAMAKAILKDEKYWRKIRTQLEK